MTTTSTETSVRREIEVAVPIERAFTVFTERFDRIKPREHNMLGVPIAEAVLDTHVDGAGYGAIRSSRGRIGGARGHLEVGEGDGRSFPMADGPGQWVCGSAALSVATTLS